MIRFFETHIDESREAEAVADVCKAAIREVRRYKAYEDANCRHQGRPRLLSADEMMEKWSKEPYRTLNAMYKVFEKEFYKLPYSILWKIEACMMTGADLSDQGETDPGDDFDIGNGDSISVRDFEGLASFFDIPTSTETGGNVQNLIEYVCSKRDLDKYLSLYLKAAGIERM